MAECRDFVTVQQYHKFHSQSNLSFLITTTTTFMPEAIPSILAPYLESCLIDSSLTLVTSTLSTPACWLLVRLLYSAVQSRDTDNESNASSRSSSHVMFLSLLRPLATWQELTRRLVCVLLSSFGDLTVIHRVSIFLVTSSRGN
jgi:hypothetical protein